jgi:hypothetical protein
MHEDPPESVTKPEPRGPVRNLPSRVQISQPGGAGWELALAHPCGRPDRHGLRFPVGSKRLAFTLWLESFGKSCGAREWPPRMT